MLKLIVYSFNKNLSALFILVFVLSFFSCSRPKEKLLEFNCKRELLLNLRKTYSECDRQFRISLMDLWEGSLGKKSICSARDFSDSSLFVFFTDSTLSIKGKEAVFAIYKADTSLCVNSKYFSDLIQVDVCNFSDYHTIGLVKKPLQNNFADERIIDLLFRSFILRTFTHLDPQICLLSVDEYSRWNSYSYVATYETCSNHCTDHQSAFEVTISKKTGEISVRPLNIADNGIQQFVKK